MLDYRRRGQRKREGMKEERKTRKKKRRRGWRRRSRSRKGRRRWKRKLEQPSDGAGNELYCRWPSAERREIPFWSPQRAENRR